VALLWTLVDSVLDEYSLVVDGLHPPKNGCKLWYLKDDDIRHAIGPCDVEGVNQPWLLGNNSHATGTFCRINLFVAFIFFSSNMPREGNPSWNGVLVVSWDY
jgi:hypothetical protein